MASELLVAEHSRGAYRQWPKAICLRCTKTFPKTRIDKVYCSIPCQKDWHGQHPQYGPDSRRATKAMSELHVYLSMPELAMIFEQATGMPFAFKLANMPRRRHHQAEAPEHREEQGQLWWNSGTPPMPGEPDPVDVERQLLARSRVPGQPAGETEDEWRSRGGIVKVLPPGKAAAF
jgi:hypothetical protein